MNASEREIQKALGTLHRYRVHICRNRINSIVGCRETATSEEEAIRQAAEMLRHNTPKSHLHLLDEVRYVVEEVVDDE